jgi:hypothetical protein
MKDLRRNAPRSGPPVPNMGGIIADHPQTTIRTPPTPGLNTDKNGRPPDMSSPLTPVGAQPLVAPILIPPQLGAKYGK